mmetsp:Transcript_3845/g.6719  ORF Transcript_3845/g.6719 Transcript_3845/m.6719 type:complete len:287 (-) Transcript_3845:2207-3067(-)
MMKSAWILNASIHKTTLNCTQCNTNTTNSSPQTQNEQPFPSFTTRRDLLSKSINLGISTIACLLPYSHVSIPPAFAAEYDSYANHYDVLDNGTLSDVFKLSDLRRILVSKAHGNVLEIAVGTGLNLPFYDPIKVQSVTAIDISDGMLRIAQQRKDVHVPVSFKHLDASQVVNEFGEAHFDTVLCTYSLCTMKDPELTLNAMRSVLVESSSSRLLLLDHAASDSAIVRAYQDFTEPAVTALSKSCKWNIRVEELVKDSRMNLNLARVQRSLAGTVIFIEAFPETKTT